jgi:hypothetical protein
MNAEYVQLGQWSNTCMASPPPTRLLHQRSVNMDEISLSIKPNASIGNDLTQKSSAGFVKFLFLVTD